MTAPVNVLRTAAGKQRAVCEFCGRMSHAVRPGLGTRRLSIFDLPSGWACAPYSEDFTHADGSTGSRFTCPPCGRRIRNGDLPMHPRREPKL